MKSYLYLSKSQFTDKEQLIFKNEKLSAVAFQYQSGIEAVKLINSKGFLIVLPFMGKSFGTFNLTDKLSQ